MSKHIECYECYKKFSSWQYLYYHKRKVHDMNVESKMYDREMKNKEKEEAEKAKKCLFCPKMYRKPTMEEHYKKKHKECFAWIECGLCYQSDKDVRYDVIFDHMMGHNDKRTYGRKDDYFLPPEKLQTMLDDAGGFQKVQDILKQMIKEKKEKDEISLQNQRELANMDRSDLKFSYCPLSGDMLGCRW